MYKNFYIVSKYIDYYRNLYYNKGVKLSKSNMWLVMLSSKNFMELYETLGYILNDEKRDKFIKKVRRLCMEDFNIGEWEKEKCQELVEYTKISNAREEGIEDGRVDGIKETAKKMLEKNTDINFVSEVTNLSIEEIMKIKESL